MHERKRNTPSKQEHIHTKETGSCHEKGSIFSVYSLESPVFKEKKTRMGRIQKDRLEIT